MIFGLKIVDFSLLFRLRVCWWWKCHACFGLHYRKKAHGWFGEQYHRWKVQGTEGSYLWRSKLVDFMCGIQCHEYLDVSCILFRLVNFLRDEWKSGNRFLINMMQAFLLINSMIRKILKFLSASVLKNFCELHLTRHGKIVEHDLWVNLRVL